MSNLGKITVSLTILLLIFCYSATRADRTELTVTLPPETLHQIESNSAEFGLSVEAGGSFSSIMQLAYPDLDLGKEESTWARLVRETISLNEGRVTNPDPARLHDPSANRVEPGTVLQLPAIAVVEEGDTGIGRVLLRLNPELRGNGRALLGAIKSTIAANADLIRKTDVNQLYDGRFNVIVVGDVLILPPEVMPREMIHHEAQPHAMVAEKTAAAEAAMPSTAETVEEAAGPVAAVAEPEVVKTVEASPPTTETVEEAAGPVAAVVEPELVKTVEASPPITETVEEAAGPVAAVVEPQPEQNAAAPRDGEPYPAIIGEAFNSPIAPAGPIGLTAWETRRPAVPVKKSIRLAGAHLLIAYLLAVLAFLGGLVILITRWLERDRKFKAQVSLLFSVAVFLITLGRVWREPAVEPTKEGTDRLALSDPEGQQEHSNPA
jgi:hypothetical protein